MEKTVTKKTAIAIMLLNFIVTPPLSGYLIKKCMEPNGQISTQFSFINKHSSLKVLKVSCEHVNICVGAYKISKMYTQYAPFFGIVFTYAFSSFAYTVSVPLTGKATPYDAQKTFFQLIKNCNP